MNYLNLFAVGIIFGLISPLILSLLKYFWIWKNQKKLKTKYKIFEDTVRALSMYAADALDPILQHERKSNKEINTRKVELRLETSELLEKSRGMVEAYFSKDIYNLFDAAIRTKISIEETPCIDFELARTKVIIAMSKKLGLK